jgi:hypothetical protein
MGSVCAGAEREAVTTGGTMNSRAYHHACPVFLFTTCGALLIARGTVYTDGVPWMVVIGILFAGVAAAVFTSAVTRS